MKTCDVVLSAFIGAGSQRCPNLVNGRLRTFAALALRMRALISVSVADAVMHFRMIQSY